ncbi:MAG TPA: ATP-binding protein [Pyrinomonadaceae bacterium]|nr:ATP-binding protein [Pyrinomonadaceae bacterium]
MNRIGERFGVLAESNTTQLTVIARNTDVAVGDLFLLPCRRGPDRFYIFRTTQYANVLSRLVDVNEVARNKLTMPDSFLAEDLADEKLIELKGMVLGYAEWAPRSEQWNFHRPRRLPQHLSDVYHVDHANPQMAKAVCTLMQSQLGESGLYIGDLLAGEQSLAGVPVFLPPHALSHHIGVFGRTGSGKSNLMMVLLRSILEHNHAVVGGKQAGPPASIFAIDPHDEFRHWHLSTGGADGIHGIVNTYTATERASLIEPFYYLSAKNLDESGLERRVLLSRADVTPDDLISISEFTEQQIAYSNGFFAFHGERWIGRLLLGDTGSNRGDDDEAAAEYLPGTITAVQRRVGFLRHGHTRVFTRFDPEAGLPYRSSLPDIICAIESGRVLIVDTTLMSEIEQFLLTTIVARVLFAIRKALRSAESSATLQTEIRQALGNDDGQGQTGMRSLADELVRRIERGELPYLERGEVKSQDRLPYVNIVVEEAPSVLNPQRMKFGSVFRDISRQGRKFGIGLTVVSQQISEIDSGVLTQINTELTMALGNENERREAMRNASADLFGFERELQVMGRGQVILSASYKDIPLPLLVPDYDSGSY